MSDEYADRTGTPKRFEGPGGTSGGAFEFIIGAALVVVGCYLVMQHVMVYSGYWGWFGPNTFGLTLVPLLFGIGLVFFDGRSILGWVLAATGALIMFAGIIANLSISFMPASLFQTVMMFGMIAAGLGLVARAVRAH